MGDWTLAWTAGWFLACAAAYIVGHIRGLDAGERLWVDEVRIAQKDTDRHYNMRLEAERKLSAIREILGERKDDDSLC